MKREKGYITKRLPVSYKYQLFAFANGEMSPIDEIVVDKRPKEAELAKEYKVDKVVAVLTETITKAYRMRLDDFIENAELIQEDAENAEDAEEAE